MAANNRKHPLGDVGGFSHSAPGSNEVTCLRARITVAADHELNDTFDLLKLPAEHKIVDATLVVYNALAASALVLDVGVIDTVQDPSDTTDVDAIFDGETIGVAGGVARVSLSKALNVAIRPYDRVVRLLMQVGGVTPAGGDIELFLYVSPKQANGNDLAKAMAT
jgi:hypothetical protein